LDITELRVLKYATRIVHVNPRKPKTD